MRPSSLLQIPAKNICAPSARFAEHLPPNADISSPAADCNIVPLRNIIPLWGSRNDASRFWMLFGQEFSYQKVQHQTSREECKDAEYTDEENKITKCRHP